ncbi:glycosyltransferase [Kocuria sp. M1R5S2]|uniref:CgeB family protein n=1 Tax=Kocuria rhizosphaerae TaxID=3376285 RepID=UPI0037AB1273
MSAGEKLLLVGPAFHGYHRSIARAWEALGYDVVSHCYDAFGTTAEKLRNKLRHELPSRLGLDGARAAERWATSRTLEVLRAVAPDRVVVIKGDSLGDAFWEEVDTRAVPRILWLYDDLKRHRYTTEFLRWVGPVAGYARSETDALRAEGVDAHFVPNAFDPDLAAPPADRVPEVVFVGSRYPNRVELMTGLHRQGVPVRVYGRQWSHHPFDRLRTWELTRPDLPAERDVPLHEAYTVQARAAAAVNIHGLQAGHAMRSFEVPGMNGLQIVDRADIEEFYDVGTEVLRYGSPEELAELSRRALRDTAWAEGIRAAGRRRTLAEHTFAHRVRGMEAMWH